MDSKEKFMLSDNQCGLSTDGSVLPACETGSMMDRFSCYKSCISMAPKEPCSSCLSCNTSVMDKFNMYGSEIAKQNGGTWSEIPTSSCLGE